MQRFSSVFAAMVISVGCWGCDGPSPQSGSTMGAVDLPVLANAPRKRQKPKIAPVATALRGLPIFTDAVKAVRFDPTGELVATGSADGSVTLFRGNGGHVLLKLQAHETWAFDIAFSPDGESFVTGGGDNAVRLWSANKSRRKQPRKEFKGHTDDVHAVAFTPDGKKIVSGSDDTTLIVWEIETGESRPLEGHDKQVTSLDVSPDGRQVASGSRDGTVRVWNLDDGSVAHVLRGHTADVLSVEFSPDGRTLASASYDKTVRVWDVDRGKESKRFNGHTDLVFTVAFGADGRTVASGGGDGTVRVWDTQTGENIQIERVNSDVADLDYSNDGRFLAASTAGAVVVLYAVSEGTLSQIATYGSPASKASIELGTLQKTLKDVERSLAAHRIALDWQHEQWLETVADLGRHGDRFSLELFKSIDSDSLTVTQREMLDRVTHQIRTRHDGMNDNQFVAYVQTRLERAALSDLSCGRLESTLVPWTLKTIRSHASRPAVHEELERVRDSYVPSGPVPAMIGGQRGLPHLQARVREYARRALDADGSSAAKFSP